MDPTTDTASNGWLSNWTMPSAAQITSWGNTISADINAIAHAGGQIAGSVGSAQTNAQTAAAVVTQDAAMKQQAAMNNLPVFMGLTTIQLVVIGIVGLYIAHKKGVV